MLSRCIIRTVFEGLKQKVIATQILPLLLDVLDVPLKSSHAKHAPSPSSFLTGLYGRVNS